MKTEVKRDYYKSGTSKSETTWVNGQRHVVRRNYHSSGELCNETTWVNGQLRGIKWQYYRSGKLYREEDSWLNEQRHGEQRLYINGELIDIAYYLYGNQVTAEEYRKHELIIQLAGLNET